MNCPQCGEAIEPDWDECPACETPLSAHCSQCGREVKSNWKKCPACKTRLESGSASSEWSLANEAPSGAGVGGASVQWSMPEPGTALDGKGNLEAWARPRDPRWEVAETLGRGGMGVVFKCRDQRLKRWVAIKRVLCPDAKALSRFRREAEAIAGLPHPNILQIHDFLEDEAGPFIVMEYASGGDLETQVKRNGPLSVDRCVEVLTDVANGLSAAHERRNPDTREREPVLHRDIKPSNMLLMADGTPKLSDFGLARLTGSSTLTLVPLQARIAARKTPEKRQNGLYIGFKLF